MRRTAAAFIGCLAFSTAANAQAPICGDAIQLWEIEDQGLRFLTYRPGETISYGPVLFEAYEGDQLLWRIEGQYACSNGIVYCGVTIPTSGPEPIQASETLIYEGDVPQYVVYSDLLQNAYWRQARAGEVIKAEFGSTSQDGLNPTSPPLQSDAELRIPSYYRFAGCRPQGEAYD